MSDKIKLSTESYKGVRDFYPEDMFVQNYIFDTWKKVLESFGYAEYSASLLEPAELYRAKTGEEIVNEQTYTFTDRGGREVTLRPEMTPTVARMVAAKERELAFPLRWYSIPNLFRYEKPQRGRLREHWQLNVDLFGLDSIQADTEIISIAYNLMKKFGAKDEDFEIHIGSRKFLKELLAKLGIENESDERAKKLYKLLDRKAKIGEAEFENGLKELNISFPEVEAVGSSEDISQIMKLLNDVDVKSVLFDPGIVRGFDYYTGMVFEVFDTNPENKRSLFGGGRYDDLTAIFGGGKISAVGFGMGDVTIKDFLETRGLLPKYKSATELYICTLDKTFLKPAQKLRQSLREQGLNVAVNLTDKKVGDQIKIADKQKIPYIVVVGENEVSSGTYSIKNMETGEETKVVIAGITGIIRSHS
ncbi:MAG: histidine--tRNA ligase [Candidatus Zambryskibacteria bacterium]|nr:histidine--tRNA ligase [Candidatus Zambryskibacteria bacterium]